MINWTRRSPRLSKASAAFADPAAGADRDRGGIAHDLEAHLSELRTLDELRRQSGNVRDAGWNALVKLIAQNPVGSGSDDLLHCARSLRIALNIAKDSADISEVVARLEELKAKITLAALAADQQSVIVAAEALQAFAAHPTTAMCKESMLCWYWIMREIYTATAPDWSAGGARAFEKDETGWVTAYATSQCIDGIDALAACLERTASYFDQLSRIEKRERMLDDKSIPKRWRDVDRERLRRSREITLTLLRRGASAPLLPPPSQKDEAMFATNRDALASDIVESIQKQLTAALSEIEVEWGKWLVAKKDRGATISAERDARRPQLERLRNDREGVRSALRKAASPEDRTTSEADLEEIEGKIRKLKTEQAIQDREEDAIRRQEAATTSAHAIALRAIEKGVQRAEIAASGSNMRSSTLAEHFAAAARVVREGLDLGGYLSFVIDAQLVHASSADPQRLDAAELAFAARAHFCHRQPQTSELARLARVIQCLLDKLPSDGAIATSAFHVIEDPTQGPINVAAKGAEAVTAVADLIRFARFPLDRATAARFLPNLLERRVTRGEKLQGWRRAGSRKGPGAMVDLEATALAVNALAAINDMLDDGINDMVLDHFSVTEPNPDAVNLDGLFYPDYGLHQQAEEERTSRPASAFGRPSVALTLQRMRAHVTPAGSDPLHSLVLHGPAGTGKTTLVEALANTCEVPKVEVTPSDIAKAGEAAIEQRARAVFEALALLTRVVIIFDEFDPIVKRRDTTGNTAASIFSFLTPGMLPKLKNLSESAKKRSVAYVLVTNLIGTLDEAAVRNGRFDERVGVFPPDPLSRLGQLMHFYRSVEEKEYVTINPERLVEVAVKTSGGGMTTLGSKGWFTRGSARDRKDWKPGSPLPYICELGENATFSAPDREEEFGEMKGSGVTAALEYRQWGWVAAWDEAVMEKWETCRSDLNKGERKPIDLEDMRALMECWPQGEAVRTHERLLRRTEGVDRELVSGLLGDEILLRWSTPETGLYARIKTGMNGVFGADAIRQALAYPLLNSSDLYVFSHCAKQALQTPLMKRSAIVSRMIYVAVLSDDIYKLQEALREPATNGRKAPSDSVLEKEWKRLEELVDSLDGAIASLFVWLWDDYEPYLKANAPLWKKDNASQQDHGKQLMNEARRTRIGDDQPPPD